MRIVLLFLALRYLRRRWRTTLLTVGAVALGVFAMSFMASMMLGLSQKFIDSVTTAAPHIEVKGRKLGLPPRLFVSEEGEERDGLPSLLMPTRPVPQRLEKPLRGYSQLCAIIESVEGIVAAAPQVRGKALLVYGGISRAVNLWGITPEAQERVISVREYLHDAIGDLALVPDGCYLGKELMRRSGIPVGTRVVLIGPNGTKRTLRVLARYWSGVRETDELICIVRLSVAQQLLGYGNEVTSIAVRVSDVQRAYALARIVERRLGYEATSWQEANANYLALFNLQNLITAILLTATLLVAGFGIANGLITVVLQKQKDIGILKAMGLTDREVAGVFLLKGLLIGTLGSLVALPLAAHAIEAMSKVPLSGEGVLTTETFTMLRHPAIYFVPIVIGIGTSAIAALFPARKAAQYDPVEIVRSAGQ